MLAHQQDPVPPLPSTLDPEFCEIIYKALAKNPADRWQSAEEFIQVLYKWLEETSWVDEVPGGDTPFTGQPAARDSGQLTSPRATPTHGQVSAKGTPIGLPGLTRGPAASSLTDSGIVPGRAPASFAAQPEAPIELDRSTPARPVRAVVPRTTAQRPDSPAKQGSGAASAVTALVVLLVIAAAGFAIWKKRQAPADQAAPSLTAPAPSQGLSPSLSDTP
jgi:serine/threonine-protein kinase